MVQRWPRLDFEIKPKALEGLGCRKLRDIRTVRKGNVNI